MSNVVW